MKMKKFLALVLFTGIIPAMLTAQSNPLDGLMKRYAEQPGFYFLEMKTNMFNLGNEENVSAEPGKSISMKLLSYRAGSSSGFSPIDIYNQFTSGIDIQSYIGLVEVKNSGEKVEMMVKKEGSKINEIIILIQEKDEATIISASGSFDMKDISKLSEMKNCHAFETLNKLCEE